MPVEPEPQTAGRQLELARHLVGALECGDAAETRRCLEELTRWHESEVYREIGCLARTLHDAFNRLLRDGPLGRIARHEMPDARERLRFVVARTEESAHRTLKAVEDSLPVARRLEQGARRLQESWARRPPLATPALHTLAGEVEAFLPQVRDGAAVLLACLSEARLAQEYQDITGQVIERVITLLQETERGLVELLRATGQHGAGGTDAPQAATIAQGPQIKTGGDTGAVSGQDEVDQLLAQLGF
jgi:chemotaxis protein CheZ